MSRLLALNLLNWVGHVLLALGLCGPCMTVIPRMGEVEGLGRWLGLLQEPKTYSILSGIFQLFERGGIFVALVLFVFSVVFPIAKLIVLRVCVAELRDGGTTGVAHRLATRFSKYSMVDVFVIALVVVASRSFPGGTTVELEWGTYAFAAAALLSVAVSAALGRIAPTPDQNPLN